MRRLRPSVRRQHRHRLPRCTQHDENRTTRHAALPQFACPLAFVCQAVVGEGCYHAGRTACPPARGNNGISVQLGCRRRYSHEGVPHRVLVAVAMFLSFDRPKRLHISLVQVHAYVARVCAVWYPCVCACSSSIRIIVKSRNHPKTCLRSQ